MLALAYHILIVEDEPETRELLDFTLRWNGHHVDTAKNGREALELLAEHSYDAILSNLNMPEMMERTFIEDRTQLAAPSAPRGLCDRRETKHFLSSPVRWAPCPGPHQAVHP